MSFQAATMFSSAAFVVSFSVGNIAVRIMDSARLPPSTAACEHCAVGEGSGWAVEERIALATTGDVLELQRNKDGKECKLLACPTSGRAHHLEARATGSNPVLLAAAIRPVATRVGVETNGAKVHLTFDGRPATMADFAVPGSWRAVGVPILFINDRANYAADYHASEANKKWIAPINSVLTSIMAWRTARVGFGSFAQIPSERFAMARGVLMCTSLSLRSGLLFCVMSHWRHWTRLFDREERNLNWGNGSQKWPMMPAKELFVHHVWGLGFLIPYFLGGMFFCAMPVNVVCGVGFGLKFMRMAK